MSLETELGARLQAAGVGVPGASLFYGQLPDSPDTALALIPYAGALGSLVGERGKPIDALERVQVVSRAASYPVAQQQAQAAYNALFARLEAQGATTYLYLNALQPPFFLRRDERNRVLFAFNLEARRIP